MTACIVARSWPVQGFALSYEARALQAGDWPQLQTIEAQLCAHIDAADFLRANSRCSSVNFAHFTSSGGETDASHVPDHTKPQWSGQPLTMRGGGG
jgi:hypothetical protein